MSSSADEMPVDADAFTVGESGGSEGPGEPQLKRPKAENKPQRRGVKMTPAKRMKDFPGEFFQQGEEMWCIACQCPVDYRQISFSKYHLKGTKHLKNKKELGKQVSLPGPSVQVQVTHEQPSTQPAISGVPYSKKPLNFPFDQANKPTWRR